MNYEFNLTIITMWIVTVVAFLLMGLRGAMWLSAIWIVLATLTVIAAYEY